MTPTRPASARSAASITSSNAFDCLSSTRCARILNTSASSALRALSSKKSFKRRRTKSSAVSSSVITLDSTASTLPLALSSNARSSVLSSNPLRCDTPSIANSGRSRTRLSHSPTVIDPSNGVLRISSSNSAVLAVLPLGRRLALSNAGDSFPVVIALHSLASSSSDPSSARSNSATYLSSSASAARIASSSSSSASSASRSMRFVYSRAKASRRVRRASSARFDGFSGETISSYPLNTASAIMRVFLPRPSVRLSSSGVVSASCVAQCGWILNLKSCEDLTTLTNYEPSMTPHPLNRLCSF